FASTNVAGGGGQVSTLAKLVVIQGTLAQVNADLTTLTYLDGDFGADTVNVTTTDNIAGGDTRRIAVTSNAPVVTTVPGPQLIQGFGNDVPIAGISLADAD